MKDDNFESVAFEFDRPRDFGFVMRGWDFSSADIHAALTQHLLLNPAIQLGTNACPWNCRFCFTEHPSNASGRKRRSATEMPLQRRLHLIEEAAALGCRAINFVGAGEPTIDPDFWTIIEAISAAGITPIVYSEGSLRLGERSFAKRLFDIGATVVLKVNSLWNAAYQNGIVAGDVLGSRSAGRYTYERNRALAVLLEVGFADCVPTRLAFDTIITRRNMTEIDDLHRFARRRNIFALLVNYLPSGRSSGVQDDALTRQEQFAIFDRLARIDREEFGIDRQACFPYGGAVPCSIRGFGLYVKITGEVFDCPGEAIPLGNLREASLATIWGAARSVTASFNGGCLPRELFWRSLADRNASMPGSRTTNSESKPVIRPLEFEEASTE